MKDFEIPFDDHVRFERNLFKCFPIDPIPEPVYKRGVVDEMVQEGETFYNGKRWPEIVGYRSYRGLDTPGFWLSVVPISIATYYLPGHMLFESLQMLPAYGSGRPARLAEMFLLPPSDDEEVLQKIDEDMSSEEELEREGPLRKQLYMALTAQQRQCVSLYLDLFLRYNREWPIGRALEIFEKNRDVWMRAEPLS